MLDYRSDNYRNLYKDEVGIIHEGIKMFTEFLYITSRLKRSWKDSMISKESITTVIAKECCNAIGGENKKIEDMEKMVEFVTNHPNSKVINEISRMKSLNMYLDDKGIIRHYISHPKVNKPDCEFNIYPNRIYINTLDGVKLLNDIEPNMDPDKYLEYNGMSLEETKFVRINLFPETNISRREFGDPVGRRISFDAFIETDNILLNYIKETLADMKSSRAEVIEYVFNQLCDSYVRILTNIEFICEYYTTRIPGEFIRDFMETSNIDNYQDTIDPFDKGFIETLGDYSARTYGNFPRKRQLLFFMKDLIIINFFNAQINGISIEETLVGINDALSKLNQFIEFSGDFSTDGMAGMLPSIINSAIKPNNTLIAKVVVELSQYLANPTEIQGIIQKTFNSISKEVFDYQIEILNFYEELLAKYEGYNDPSNNSILNSTLEDFIAFHKNRPDRDPLPEDMDVPASEKLARESMEIVLAQESAQLQKLSYREKYMYGEIRTDIDLYANAVDFADTKFGKDNTIKRAANIRDKISKEMEKTKNQYYLEALGELMDMLNKIAEYSLSRNLKEERRRLIYGAMIFPGN